MSGNGIGQVFSGTHRFLQGREHGAGLELAVYRGWIKKRSNRVVGKLGGRSHELAGIAPVTKGVALQLDEIAFRVLVVQRNRYFMVEAECGLDAFLAEAVERLHQVVKTVIFE